MLKYDVVAGTLQDIVYLICTGTIQCQWPRLRGGGVKHNVMIGVCPAQYSPEHDGGFARGH